MINADYIKNFDFKTVIYLLIGISLFAAPWLLFNEFWYMYISLPLLSILLINLFSYAFLFLFFLLFFKNPADLNAVVCAAKRLLFIFVCVLAINAVMLTFFGRLSFFDPSLVFVHKLFSAQFSSTVAGVFFDLVMNK